MTDEQLIEELLLEASGLGIRQDVLDASEKYIDQGLDRLEALERAFNDLTDDDDYLDSSDIDWSDEDEDWSDEDEDWSDEDEE
jgi:hypothetical protein